MKQSASNNSTPLPPTFRSLSHHLRMTVEQGRSTGARGDAAARALPLPLLRMTGAAPQRPSAEEELAKRQHLLMIIDEVMRILDEEEEDGYQ